MTLLDESLLAPYAVRVADGGDRAFPEPPDPLRSPFALDRHRIIESTAFRRLEHKTQVFTAGLHDHFRTRMTHTLEVAQIARTLARALRANEDLSEAVALAHDLGHPPFGHAGEKALNEAMAGHGGFNHNLHSLRVVEYLEHPYPAFRGLNLTRATCDALRSHVTRYDEPEGGGEPHAPPRGGSVEAQIASMADRLAYGCHDLEDAIGAGFFALDELDALRLWREAAGRVGAAASDNIHAVRRPILDALLDRVLHDVVDESSAVLARFDSPGAVVAEPAPAVRLSTEVQGEVDELEEFLFARVYRRPEIAELDAAGRRQVLRLFAAYRADPSLLPARFAARVPEQGLERVIADYIAGMTDRFCSEMCGKLA